MGKKVRQNLFKSVFKGSHDQIMTSQDLVLTRPLWPSLGRFQFSLAWKRSGLGPTFPSLGFSTSKVGQNLSRGVFKGSHDAIMTSHDVIMTSQDPATTRPFSFVLLSKSLARLDL